MAIDDSSDHPGDNDRTVFIPRPGGRSAIPSAATPPPAPPPPPSYIAPEQLSLTSSGINPLVGTASALLKLASSTSNMVSHHDVEGLRRQAMDEIKGFEGKARALGLANDVTYTGRYVLCAFIDESVLNTIWGSSSVWAQQGLLSSLHNETSGGETFFVILDRLLKDPNASLELLELMFVCISLGFKGRYAVVDRGQEKLEELRNVVFEHIRRRRGEFPRELSPHWQSQSGQKRSLRQFIPLWVVVAVASAILMAIFIGFTVVLEERSEPVYESLENIASPEPGAAQHEP
ncbi:MAG: type IVB secretion system protein IcmH/DotU [Gammaproteobacteria bacterium]|nr:type IVB secretion system protein IcmH/DotU [Gammaproteobacteria bacterium]MCF6363015.1 type IVB secretion system protein IcmH/DotU [Gammaproteobacteria bacterium]